MILHKKNWGWEHWFINNEKYCGKLLFVRKGQWSSKGRYHYHKIKDETFFVIEGELKLDFYKNDVYNSIILKRFKTFHVPPGMKHKFTSITKEGCQFIEASTTHMDSDSYRCELNDSGEWVE